MNKKYFWSLLTLTMVAILSLGFASCSSDDDDDNNLFVGKWIGDHSSNRYTDFYFYSNGKGKMDEMDDGVGTGRDFTYVITSMTERDDEYWGTVYSGTMNLKIQGDEYDWNFETAANWLHLGGYDLHKVDN